MNPEISIIVPVYNTVEYLEKCLDSILSDSELEIEVIVIDDASTDNSLQIIKDYSLKDSRVRYIALEDNTPGGCGIPSNIGIEKARGKYIGFVDSDDWIVPGMFSRLYREAEDTASDYVFCDFYQYNSLTSEITPSYDQDRYPEMSSLQSVDYLKISPVPWRKLYRRDFLLENNLRFPEGDFFFEDTPFHFTTTLTATKISYIKETLYYHRIFRENQTMFGKGDKFLAFLKHYQFMYNFLKSHNLENQYGRDFILYILDNFFWVWDRLNLSNRKKFFSELKEILNLLDLEILDNFLSSEELFHKKRLKYVLNNQFWQYADFMFTYKHPLGFVKRNIHFLKEHGTYQFCQKVIRKFRFLKFPGSTQSDT